MLKSSTLNCHLELKYWQYLWNLIFYKIFEGELLVLFWIWFLFQFLKNFSFALILHALIDFIKITKLLLAAESINGLNMNALAVYNFG